MTVEKEEEEKKTWKQKSKQKRICYSLSHSYTKMYNTIVQT